MAGSELTDLRRKDLDDDQKIEETFQELRRDGLSRLEAVRAILDVLDVSLREAKRILATSETWGEARQAADSSPARSSTDRPPPAPG